MGALKKVTLGIFLLVLGFVCNASMSVKAENLSCSEEIKIWMAYSSAPKSDYNRDGEINDRDFVEAYLGFLNADKELTYDRLFEGELPELWEREERPSKTLYLQGKICLLTNGKIAVCYFEGNTGYLYMLEDGKIVKESLSSHGIKKAVGTGFISKKREIVRPLEADKVYKIVNMETGQVMVPQTPDRRATPVVLVDDYPSPYTLWKPYEEISGGYFILNVGSEMGLDVYQRDTKPGVVINQFPYYPDASNQYFSLQKRGENAYSILCNYINNFMIITPKPRVGQEPVGLEQNVWTGSPSQVWIFKEVEGVPPTIDKFRPGKLKGHDFELTFEASDDSGLAKLSYVICTQKEGESYSVKGTLEINGDGRYQLPVRESDFTATDGIYTVQLTALDQIGNQITKEETVNTNTLVIPLSDFTISQETLTLAEGAKQSLSVATVDPEDTTIPLTAVWSSTEEAVAGINEAGEVTALHAGTTIITCNIAGIEKKCNVTVEHVMEEISPVAAGCEADGSTAGIRCKQCGEIFTAPRVIPATGHFWDQGEITTKPTTQEPGVRTYHCMHCSKTYTETIEKLADRELVKGADGTLYYYENGQVAEGKYGFAEVGGVKLLIVGGKYETSINGLYNDPEHPSDWYYLAEGRAQTQYTGLAMYDGAWFYVGQGKLDTNVAGFVEYDGGLFYVGVGRIMTEVNGLAQDTKTGDWYYLAAGQAQTQYTGLAQYDNHWFYVINGKLAKDYTGSVTYNGAQFMVYNGMLQ